MFALDSENPAEMDIVVDYDRASRFSLLTLSHIKLIIEDDTGLDVHITTVNGMPASRRIELDRAGVKVF